MTKTVTFKVPQIATNRIRKGSLAHGITVVDEDGNAATVKDVIYDNDGTGILGFTTDSPGADQWSSGTVLDWDDAEDDIDLQGNPRQGALTHGAFYSAKRGGFGYGIRPADMPNSGSKEFVFWPDGTTSVNGSTVIQGNGAVVAIDALAIGGEHLAHRLENTGAVLFDSQEIDSDTQAVALYPTGTGETNPVITPANPDGLIYNATSPLPPACWLDQTSDNKTGDSDSILALTAGPYAGTTRNTVRWYDTALTDEAGESKTAQLQEDVSIEFPIYVGTLQNQSQLRMGMSFLFSSYVNPGDTGKPTITVDDIGYDTFHKINPNDMFVLNAGGSNQENIVADSVSGSRLLYLKAALANTHSANEEIAMITAQTNGKNAAGQQWGATKLSTISSVTSISVTTLSVGGAQVIDCPLPIGTKIAVDTGSGLDEAYVITAPTTITTGTAYSLTLASPGLSSTSHVAGASGVPVAYSVLSGALQDGSIQSGDLDSAIDAIGFGFYVADGNGGTSWYRGWFGDPAWVLPYNTNTYQTPVHLGHVPTRIGKWIPLAFKASALRLAQAKQKPGPGGPVGADNTDLTIKGLEIVVYSANPGAGVTVYFDAHEMGFLGGSPESTKGGSIKGAHMSSGTLGRRVMQPSASSDLHTYSDITFWSMQDEDSNWRVHWETGELLVLNGLNDPDYAINAGNDRASNSVIATEDFPNWGFLACPIDSSGAAVNKVGQTGGATNIANAKGLVLVFNSTPNALTLKDPGTTTGTSYIRPYSATGGANGQTNGLGVVTDKFDWTARPGGGATLQGPPVGLYKVGKLGKVQDPVTGDLAVLTVGGHGKRLASQQRKGSVSLSIDNPQSAIKRHFIDTIFSVSATNTGAGTCTVSWTAGTVEDDDGNSGPVITAGSVTGVGKGGWIAYDTTRTQLFDTGGVPITVLAGSTVNTINLTSTNGISVGDSLAFGRAYGKVSAVHAGSVDLSPPLSGATLAVGNNVWRVNGGFISEPANFDFSTKAHAYLWPVGRVSKNIDSATGQYWLQGWHVGSLQLQGSQIANLSITAAQIANLSIDATKIANATITATQIATADINGGTLVGTGSITALKVNTADINAGNLVGTGSITAAKIQTATITAAQIHSATITAGTIANLTINAGNIDNYILNRSKLSGTASPGKSGFIGGAVFIQGNGGSGHGTVFGIRTIAGNFTFSDDKGGFHSILPSAAAASNIHCIGDSETISSFDAHPLGGWPGDSISGGLITYGGGAPGAYVLFYPNFLPAPTLSATSGSLSGTTSYAYSLVNTVNDPAAGIIWFETPLSAPSSITLSGQGVSMTIPAPPAIPVDSLLNAALFDPTWGVRVWQLQSAGYWLLLNTSPASPYATPGTPLTVTAGTVDSGLIQPSNGFVGVPSTAQLETVITPGGGVFGSKSLWDSFVKVGQMSTAQDVTTGNLAFHSYFASLPQQQTDAHAPGSIVGSKVAWSNVVGPGQMIAQGTSSHAMIVAASNSTTATEYSISPIHTAVLSMTTQYYHNAKGGDWSLAFYRTSNGGADPNGAAPTSPYDQPLISGPQTYGWTVNSDNQQVLGSAIPAILWETSAQNYGVAVVGVRVSASYFSVDWVTLVKQGQATQDIYLYGVLDGMSNYV